MNHLMLVTSVLGPLFVKNNTRDQVDSEFVKSLINELVTDYKPTLLRLSSFTANETDESRDYKYNCQTALISNAEACLACINSVLTTLKKKKGEMQTENLADLELRVRATLHCATFTILVAASRSVLPVQRGVSSARALNSKKKTKPIVSQEQLYLDSATRAASVAVSALRAFNAIQSFNKNSGDDGDDTSPNLDDKEVKSVSTETKSLLTETKRVSGSVPVPVSSTTDEVESNSSNDSRGFNANEIKTNVRVGRKRKRVVCPDE